MSSEHREKGHKAHKAKLARMLGEAEHRADTDIKKHLKNAYHLSPAKIAKIADHEIEVKGTPKKHRLDRAARKKGGRTGKGNVNIIIAQKPDQPQGAMPMGGAPMAPPPRPPLMPPQGAMPAMPPQVPGAMPGAAAGIPPQMPRKKGGRADHPDTDYHYGACSGLGRLEKAAKYGARK